MTVVVVVQVVVMAVVQAVLASRGVQSANAVATPPVQRAMTVFEILPVVVVAAAVNVTGDAAAAAAVRLI